MASADLSFADRDGFIWFNDRLVPWRSAQVHMLTHALHYASSVFEGVRAYNGKIFKAREHNERLIRSAGLLNMDIGKSVDEIATAIEATVAANGLENCYIRPLVWRGAEKMGVASKGTKVNFAVATWAWPNLFGPEKRLEGIRLEISKWKRPAPDTAPSTAKAAGLYMICTLSKDTAAQNGYDDALMYDYKGRIAEATGANIFFVKGDTIHTPTTECILNGITRLTVMEIAKFRGLKVVEREIYPPEMSDFEEAFVTGTAAEVTPLREIGVHKFKVGKVCTQMVKDYDDLVYGRLNL